MCVTPSEAASMCVTPSEAASMCVTLSEAASMCVTPSEAASMCVTLSEARVAGVVEGRRAKGEGRRTRSRRGVATCMLLPEFLQNTIPGFPGYDDDVSRERSDEYVRSYAGERLADLQARLQPLDMALGDRIEALLLRCAFVNQAAYKLYEGNDRSAINVDAVVTADAAAVKAADRAASVDAEQLPQYLDEITRALDARDTAMSGARSVAG